MTLLVASSKHEGDHVAASRTVSAIRRVSLPILRRINLGDVSIRHHWTGRRITVHSFKHKGYWFHRGSRELDTMIMAARLLGPGDRVVEVGGHIGYLTEFFAEMVGPAGQVDVYEPDPANLPYLKQNMAERLTVSVRETAIADESGDLEFFVEDLSGQNSSLLADYSGLRANERSAGISAVVRRISVPAERLDVLYADATRMDFLKIDVEGAELRVLKGGTEILSRLKPIILIEISQEHEAVVEHLVRLGYRLVTPEGLSPTDVNGNSNYFALHREAHKEYLEGIGLTGD